MMLTRRNGTTITNVPRVDPGARQSSRVAVTVTRLEDSSRVALSIGSDATNLVRSYDIPLHQFLQLVAAVVTADDLARAGIAPGAASPAAVGAAAELAARRPGTKAGQLSCLSAARCVGAPDQWWISPPLCPDCPPNSFGDIGAGSNLRTCRSRGYGRGGSARRCLRACSWTLDREGDSGYRTGSHEQKSRWPAFPLVTGCAWARRDLNPHTLSGTRT
jgi:hypothetical protein